MRSGRIKMQMYFSALAIFNALYSAVPSFMMRKLMLTATGSRIGMGSSVHGGVRFFGFGRITVGDHSTVNRDCFLDNRGSIRIGNNVSVSHGCKIYTAGHDYNDPEFAVTCRDVVIEDYAALFAHVMLMPGVTVGRGAVVFPGSVVTKNVEPFAVVGGNPARVIKKRKTDMTYTIDYRYFHAL